MHHNFFPLSYQKYQQSQKPPKFANSDFQSNFSVPEKITEFCWFFSKNKMSILKFKYWKDLNGQTGLGFWKALEKTLYTTIQYIPLSAARDPVATVVALPWGCFNPAVAVPASKASTTLHRGRAKAKRRPARLSLRQPLLLLLLPALFRRPKAA